MSKPSSQILELLTTQSVANKVLQSYRHDQDRGLADAVRFPFLAIVGQSEMKLALLLVLVNRHIGGVLLVGPRGTAKTTAVRGLTDLMPTVSRSLCPEGCDDEAAQIGLEALCPNCQVKFKAGEPLTRPDPMRLIELPLNARLDDVVGGADERKAVEQQKIVINRGILAQADKNLLYIDEVNLLEHAVTDAILDAAAQGLYTVRRGPLAATYNARLCLVGSMNPEEGRLRPQLQDRFGLRVLVRSLEDPEDRLELYHRAVAYRQNPYLMMAAWRDETEIAAADIQAAQGRLSTVGFADGVQITAMRWIQALGIESHRAEIALFEAARAYAALDERQQVTLDDVRIVAPLALRQRHSEFISSYLNAQLEEDQRISEVTAIG